MENRGTIGIQSMGLPTLLEIVFIILKLLRVINWSWFWVLAPIWIPLALIIVVFIVIGILFIIDEMSDK